MNTKTTSYENRGQGKATAEDASATKPGSRGCRRGKIEKKAREKKPEIHPLTAEFKDSSEDYRRHLYTTTSHTINQTLASLLRKLHEGALQPMSTHESPHEPKHSPLRLTAWAKYERMEMKLYQPLSQYRLSLHGTNDRGERKRVEVTLATRMQDFEDYLARQTEEVMRLQTQWETIVGEIWKLGVSCLGQDTMERLLFTQDGGHTTPSFPSDTTKATSTLFVPEHASSTPPRVLPHSKKRVAFDVAETNPQTNKHLAFLEQPSRYPKDSLLAPPSLPTHETRKLAKEINALGTAQIRELNKIDREKEQFWKRKTELIMQSLVEE